MTARLAAVKGMNDLLPPEMGHWQEIETTADRLMHAAGFREIRTPIVEDTSLFVRSVGEATDIVGKEMYTFADRADRSLTLRPEGTAPAARAYIEHAWHQKEPVTRWYYRGPMFRYERMKTGRYRQFYQLGAEAYGAAHPVQDVELIALGTSFLSALGIGAVSLKLNSLGDPDDRTAWAEAVAAHFAGRVGELPADAQETLARNPLRLLDSKDEAVQKAAEGVPLIERFLSAEARAHAEQVQNLLNQLGISWEPAPRLVRGLDYYTRTAWEWVVESPLLGTASAVGGGGRYDRLVESLGGPKTPAVGFAMGLDRLVLLRGAAAQAPGPLLFVAVAEPAALSEALVRVTALRNAGLHIDFDPRMGSLASQMKRADKAGARWVLVLGSAELAASRWSLKRMETGQTVDVDASGLRAFLEGERRGASP